MSFVVAVPELVEAAASDLAGIRSALGEATASASAATAAVLPAGADEVSAAIAQLFGSHGAEFQAISQQASVFHDEFVGLLNAGASQYVAAEATAQSLLGAVGAAAGTSPLQGLATFASEVVGPYQTLFATTAANLQSLGGAISANPLPFLRQFLTNQAGYLQQIGTGFVNVVANLPAELANLPISIQNAVEGLQNFQPGALAQWFVNNQIGYFNTISTSLNAAAYDFVTGLQALPASFQAAGQALAAGDFTTAFNTLSNGLLAPFITGFSSTLLDTGVAVVTPVGAIGDLAPIFTIPGQMAQNFTDLLPAGSIPAMMAQNATNLLTTVTDLSQSINLASLAIPLHVGLPLVLAIDAIGPLITTGGAAQSSLAAVMSAIQAGDLSGAAASMLSAPAVIANGFLNGQAVLPLHVPVNIGFTLDTITAIPLGGLLTPLQFAQLTLDPEVPFSPLTGAMFGGIVPGLLSYLPQQLAQAIGAAPLT
ncbi:PE family protein [Mycobacterium vicinigordonae]|uniref:PE family protein n=1 Tax=Mycobacterium vicinigordonae TaxID=1719132 RepID=A0A7D6DX67_9MYCO|nr:PE family protein [Mycobacterium vicinigordonae]QLL05970.1 PE family protein [Mycobacterium vicinigordonae]